MGLLPCEHSIRVVRKEHPGVLPRELPNPIGKVFLGSIQLEELSIKVDASSLAGPPQALAEDLGGIGTLPLSGGHGGWPTSCSRRVAFGHFLSVGSPNLNRIGLVPRNGRRTSPGSQGEPEWVSLRPSHVSKCPCA